MEGQALAGEFRVHVRSGQAREISNTNSYLCEAGAMLDKKPDSSEGRMLLL